ncbi:Dynamin-related protein 5A, partial [Bienertia sinuspersici]
MDVPQGIKDTIWEDTKREFQIDDNEEKKSIVLSACDKRWRDFKTRLVSVWITHTRYVGQDPRPPYVTYASFLTKEIWEEFVKQHEDEKFKEKSEKARAS